VYLILANQGVKKPLVSLIRSEPTVEVLHTQEPLERVLPADIVYLITNILSDNKARLPSFGENFVLDIPNVAVKTGTSRNFKDNWTMGYSPLFTIGVWVGNSDASSMMHVSGVEGAGPIFHDVVEVLKKTYGDREFFKPKEVVTAEICLPSGKLPSDICPQKRVEFFQNGMEPKEQDTLWQEQNGRLVLSLPPELRSWAKRKGYLIATDTSRKNYLKIENPQNLDEFKISRSLPKDVQKITLRAAHSSDVGTIEWLLNGKLIGRGEELPWTLLPGNFEIVAKSGKLTDTVSITVGSE
jgi:penicillin-binding protein 1C